jgi:heme-degrading monooxygenase HmoA
MIAVIFEVIPYDTQKDMYFALAAALRPELEKIPGFISVERFQSITNPEKVLSLSFWENEESVQQWRNIEMHRQAQASGRSSIFKDYHLRVARVIRDYGMFNRTEAPTDSGAFHKKL